MRSEQGVAQALAKLTKDDNKGIKRLSFDWMQGIVAGVNELDVGENGGLLSANNVIARKREIRSARARVFDSSLSNVFAAFTYEPSAFWGDGVPSRLVVMTVSGISVSDRPEADTWTTYDYGGYYPDGAPSIYTNADAVNYCGYLFIVSLDTDVIKYNVQYSQCYLDPANGHMTGALAEFTTFRAQAVTSFKSRLIFGGTVENSIDCSFRVRWSGVGVSNYDTWTGVGTGFADLLDTPGKIVKFLRILDRLFIFKTDSIWELVYVGGSTVFKPYLIVADIGMYAPRSLVAIPGLSGGPEFGMYLGSDDFYVFNGSENIPIGTVAVRDLVYGPNSMVDPGYGESVHAIYNSTDRVYMCAYRDVTDTTSPVTKILQYELSSKSWWTMDQELDINCMFDGEYSLYLTWANIDVDVKWNTIMSSWKGAYSTDPDSTVLFFTASEIYRLSFLDTIEMDATLNNVYLITPDIMNSTMTRWIQFDIEIYSEAAANVILYYSSDEGSNWVSLGTRAATVGSYKIISWYFNITKEKIRFKLSLANGVRVRKNQAFVSYKTT